MISFLDPQSLQALFSFCSCIYEPFISICEICEIDGTYIILVIYTLGRALILPGSIPLIMGIIIYNLGYFNFQGVTLGNTVLTYAV